MTAEKDEILEELNRQLDKEKERKGEPEEGRLKEPQEEPEEEEEEEEPEVKEATFRDVDNKKRKVSIKKDYECPKCGSTDSTVVSDGSTIYKYRGEILSEVRVCNDCGRRFGVVK